MNDYVLGGLVFANLLIVGGGLLALRNMLRQRPAEMQSAPAATSPLAAEIASVDPALVRQAEAQMKEVVRQAEVQAKELVRQAENKTREMIEQGRRDADRIVKEGEFKLKDDAFKRREEITREFEKTRNDLKDTERRLEKREDTLDGQQKEITEKKKTLEGQVKKATDQKELFDKKTKDLEVLIDQETKTLQKLSGLSREQAEKQLLERIEYELAEEVAARIRKSNESYQQQAEGKAREILATAVQRYASAHTAEATVSTVDIPSDDMKGRIIGREGRNIRTFEKATGVDVIVDDTPGVVVVSAFDNVRREIARISLAKLIQDGRIHPTRIEEIVAETQKEMDATILEIGRNEPTCPMLRVSVEGGGCSGFQYKFDLVGTTEPDDIVIEREGARLLIDPVSISYLGGAQIDFVDDLMGATFRIKNPNATASCGCGTSFSI